MWKISPEALINTFVDHGGALISDDDEPGNRTSISALAGEANGFNCIRENFFRQHDPWVVEDLYPVDRWIIGILAYTNEVF